MADPAEAMMAEAEELRARLEMVGRQLDLLQGMKDDKARAHETLLGVQKGTPGDEVLFPVGGNTFVAARLGENTSVLKGIGAEYAMPRPIDVAVDELKREMDALESDIQTLTQSAGQLEARYGQLAQVLNSMGAGTMDPR